MIILFVNRKQELNALRKRFKSKEFELVVIYGRRRVGKTRLILESVKGQDEHIYFYATEQGNLRNFKAVASRTVPEIEYAADNWEAMFSHLKDRIVIIDEFVNLIKEDKAVVSEFQRIVDTKLKETRTKLVLLGSSISLMDKGVLSYSSPLYGRRTGTIKLQPIGFGQIRDFFPGVGWKELAQIYGFTDGVPYYLEKVKPPFWKWLGQELRSVDTFLRDETTFLMKYEFDNPSTYSKILEAIALGKTTPSDIRDYAVMRHSDITPYLKNLQEVEMIQREVPVTSSLRSRKGRYFLKDNFLSFWFRFVQPNLSMIEEGTFSAEEIGSGYDNHMGAIFEKIAKQAAIELNKRGAFPFVFSNIGRWWEKGEEIDLVALNKKEKKALLLEVKWSDLTDSKVNRILRRLEEKSRLLGLKNFDIHYGLIGRKIKNKPEMMFDLDDFDNIFRGNG